MAINFDIKAPENLFSKIPYKRILAVIVLISGFGLFLPDIILEKMFVLDLRNSIATVLGCIFIIVVAIWIVIFSSWTFKRLYRRWLFNDKNCEKRFDKLSGEALAVVLEMYKDSSHSMRLDISSATAQILTSLWFVDRSQISTGGLEFEYYLHPWVVKFLSKNISKYSDT